MTYKYSPKDKFKTVVVHAYTNSNYNYVGLLNRKLNEKSEIEEIADFEDNIQQGEE